MTIRIAHLSDIHFGGECRPAVEAVVAAVQAFAPTLTMVTGDLTLNGLSQEFEAAARWLGHLPAARLVTSDTPSTSAPAARAAIVSCTVDMPTRSAPSARSIRTSAGVS